MARLPVDLIHINQQVAEDGLDLLLAAEASGKPFVSTIHVGHSAAALGAKFGAMRDWLTERTLRRSRGQFVAVSATSREQLIERIGSDVSVALNGVPIPEDAAMQSARREAREAWSAGEEDIVIGTVGRIEPQKAPLALIDHVAPFSESHSNLRVVWIGDGSMKSALLEHSAPYAKELPLIVDGWRNDASKRLAGLDMFCLPSVFEGLPLALLEALHAGLPVIASRADGIAEAVDQGKTGFLCNTPKEWNNAISRLLGDADLRTRMGAAARRDAQKRFSIASMAAQTLRIYQDALKQNGDRT